MSTSLSSLRDEVAAPQQQFEITVEQIRNDHLKAAKAVVRNQDILETLEEEIDYDCDQLRSFLTAAQASTSRSLAFAGYSADRLVSHMLRY
jgi:aspartate kinase